MTAAATPVPLLLTAEALPAEEVEAIRRHAAVGAPDWAVLDVTGPGAVSCVQGLITSDLEGPGDGACVYGAVLTPKGMIRADLWAWRFDGRVRLVAPLAARATVLDLLKRTLPPRLARFEDRTGPTTVLLLVGPDSLAVAQHAGLPIPDMGAVIQTDERVVARAPAGHTAPFTLAVAFGAGGNELKRALEQYGATPVSAGVLELARITAGWPRLGAEIDDKTLPQEVRFDEIGAVSYSKGCYTGQETVARLHFRGHANRGLVGLTWTGTPVPDNSVVIQDDRPLGEVTSAAWLAHSGHWIGLAKVRRELDRSRVVQAAGAPASVTDLPFTGW
ncbi:MAG TPA: glycine cleavage T C-terminal barrel domain-containing protein [Gemmatimonadales bacterium]|nr:glycine cleavage T C-terminal barrel domain-containing protein [Gemmatimonadales bacterium]